MVVLVCLQPTHGGVLVRQVVIVDKLTSFLRGTVDVYLRTELVSRITQLAERYWRACVCCDREVVSYVLSMLQVCS